MWSTKDFIYIISYVYCYLAPSAPSSTPIVDLGYARYQGVPFIDPVNKATNTQFLGIRYGAPPTGSQRFREPQPPSYTPGVQLANIQPFGSFQAGSGLAPTRPVRNGTSAAPSVDLIPAVSSEDCLFLNVHVPGDLGEKKDLAVVVFIHGGGYNSGAASWYDGNDLVLDAGGGALVVVIQYRLGLFGFLAGEKIKEGGALNAGLLDQQAALQWVQKHISKFGGDPSKVTIWGQSAGAGSVLQHIVANGGNTLPPLFRAAITSQHATFLPSQYHYNDPIPELLYSEVVNQTGCSTALDTLECLRGVDVNSLQNANVDISKSVFYGTFAFVPVVDGSLITKRPTELLKAGVINGDILLSVASVLPGVLFVNQSTSPMVADYVSQLFPNFGLEESNAAAAQYAGLGKNLSQVNAIMGESLFLCPNYFLLRAFGGRAYQSVFGLPPGPHSDEAYFYFPGLVNYDITTFGRSFSESTLNFAMTLDPNTKWDPSNITPTWHLWNGTTEMLFNVTETGDPDIHSVTTSGAMLKRCEFWQSVSPLTVQ